MAVNQEIINKIEDLRHHTYSRIIDLQQNVCPMIKRIHMNYQFEYWYDGYKYNIWEDNVHLYGVRDLPLCYTNSTKYAIFQGNMIDLVNDDKIWPFLLFINGIAIQWSKITIIHDYDYSYIRIDDFAPDESFDATMVYFPLGSKKIRYGEDNDVMTGRERKGLYFDKDGKRLQNIDFANISIRLEIFDNDIYYKDVNIKELEGNVLSFPNLPDGFVPTLNNIILFDENGLLFTPGTDKKIENEFNSAYNLFRVNTSEYPEVEYAVLMYNTSENKMASRLYDRYEDLSKEGITDLMVNNDKSTEEGAELYQDIIQPLTKEFDFNFGFYTDYDENINNAKEYITNYDFRLWRDVVAPSFPVKSYWYKGIDFKKLSDDKGYVHLSRKHSELIEDVVMMFVNNRLYSNSIDIYYTTNTVHLPIFGIYDDDDVEVLMFNECNNAILDIKIPDKNTPVYIHPEYNLEDCYLMYPEAANPSYTVPASPEGRKQYIAEIESYTVDENSKYKVNFKEDFYYGKTLSIVPKKQFRYYKYKHNKEGQYKIILPTIFNYCHDMDRYMIFINGKKIDRREFTITIMNPDRPFDQLVLYIATLLDIGDYVDIFYIPEILKETYKEDIVSSNGLLTLSGDKYPKTYPFSKYTTMVFVNGLKVNGLEIKDVDVNHMILNMDKYKRDEDGNIIYDATGDPITTNAYVDSVTNVVVVEFIDKKYRDFDTYFNVDYDDWTIMMINVFTKYGGETGYYMLEKLFGRMYEIEHPDMDYKTYFAALRSILYDAIIDYYLTRSDEATTGDPFVYDFERQEWEPNSRYQEEQTEDDPSIVKLITLFPEKDKLLDYVPSTLIADPDKVAQGQTFESAT